MDFDSDRLGDLNDGSKLIWKDGRTSLGGRVVLMTTLLLLNYTASATRISGELQSTKRPREEEDTLTSSKRTKLDTTSLKSVCHVCHFKLRKNNVKKRCFCKKLVHHSCFLADGSMCK